MRRSIADQLKLTTAALTAERGYEATSLAAIRTKAKVSNGSLYHFFPEGREGIYLALYEDLLAARTAVIQTIPAEDREPAEAIRALAEALVAFAAAHPADSAVLMMLESFVWSPDRREAARKAAAAARDAIAGWAEPLMASGKMKRLSPDLIHALLLGPIEAYIRTAIGPGSVAANTEQVTALADAVWLAVRKYQEPAKEAAQPPPPPRRQGKIADTKRPRGI